MTLEGAKNEMTIEFYYGGHPRILNDRTFAIADTLSPTDREAFLRWESPLMEDYCANWMKQQAQERQEKHA
jgi:hypothetical protein